MNSKFSSPLTGYLRGARSANLYVDVETARRTFCVLERQSFTESLTDWRISRIIRAAVEDGYDVLWVHVASLDGEGWIKYPMVLDSSLYALVK
mgnify:CR=1 FL=1